MIPLAGNLGTPVVVQPSPAPPLPAQPPVVPSPKTTDTLVQDWEARMDAGLIGPTGSREHDPTPYTRRRLKLAAAQCQQLVGAAALAGAAFGTPNPCQDMPILFPSGTSDPNVPSFYNAYAAALHDRDTIVGRPQLVQLNYMSKATRRRSSPLAGTQQALS